jgi:VWFA-related protein
MYRYRFSLLLLIVVATLAGVTAVRAQEVEDTIRIKTRVVFLDALVKDKKTNLPISNLTQQNFQVLDDGKPRDITYFSREGEARKLLALVLILDLREDGAGRFLKEAEILKSMENELAKLPPGDEVAILAMNFAEDEQRAWLTEFTNDRAKIAAALAQVREICLQNEARRAANEAAKEAATQSNNEVAKPADKADAQSAAPSESKKKEVVATETNKGRSGAVVTRKTMSDGSVDVTRVSKNGKMTIELGEVYDMAAAVRDATRKAQELRPNSQMSLVWVSDGIAPIFYEDRDATEQIITRDNVIFNSLTVELRTLFKFLLPIGKPIAGWMGMSLYGSAKQLAQQSGGEAVKVGRVKDYGAGLSRIMGNLTARYSLGFTLAENETDDGRLHHLEVRVTAPDDKGKKRKLLVSSRQGYYMATSTKDVRARAQ